MSKRVGRGGEACIDCAEGENATDSAVVAVVCMCL